MDIDILVNFTTHLLSLAQGSTALHINIRQVPTAKHSGNISTISQIYITALNIVFNQKLKRPDPVISRKGIKIFLNKVGLAAI
jgi:hypothetical protein